MTSYRIVYECAGRRESQELEADGWRTEEGWVEFYRAGEHPMDSLVSRNGATTVLAPPIAEVLLSVARERVSLVQTIA